MKTHTGEENSLVPPRLAAAPKRQGSNELHREPGHWGRCDMHQRMAGYFGSHLALSLDLVIGTSF